MDLLIDIQWLALGQPKASKVLEYMADLRHTADLRQCIKNDVASVPETMLRQVTPKLQNS
ncbi:hypothetical protein J6590_075550 [Homalodisca vitripennis]|nr:hypothetical protein J6590_016224 [Homalodisca vitripennis]KAG8335151.1 hypothetical protein J6590_075550 [Homalodisca vitripennis]